MATTWAPAGNLRGPQGNPGVKGDTGSAGAPGSPGAPGADGAAGAAGLSILSGSGAPAAGTGRNGEFYLDVDRSRFYGPKVAGAWPGTYIVLDAAALAVIGKIRAGTVAASLTSDAAPATGYANLINLTVTGNVTINALSNPTDFQIVRHHLVAVGASRTVTFAGGYVAAPNLTSGLGPWTVPRGKVLSTVSEYIGNRATSTDVAAPAWSLAAAYVSG